MAGPSLYLDEDVRVLLAEVLRSRGYQATHVLEVKRTGKSDAEQLAYAAKNGMAILTHNIRDYVILDKSYQTAGKNHFGIIISGQIPFNELLRRTLKCLSSNSKESLKNRLIWLQDYR
jgi:predicted nuclease of predicted toxin-antitoxin system